MNSEYRKTSDAHRVRVNLMDKIDLQRGDNPMALSNLSIYCTWKNIKNFYKNKFKISETTWDEDFELPDGSFSISDIQEYFNYIIKKHKTLTEKTQVQVYVSKIKNWVTFKIKSGYYVKLLAPETIKQIRSMEEKIIKDKNGENVPYLKSIEEVLLVHCNVVKNQYLSNSWVLPKFGPNKSFDHLLNISPTNHIYTETS